MDLTQLTKTMQALYEGRTDGEDLCLAADMEFHDPVVIVRGRSPVLRMFRRLNWIFPETRIESFEPIEGKPTQFSLCVHYRRRAQSKPRVFKSVVDIDVRGDQILQLVEHWKSPISLTGGSQIKASRWIRGGLGKLLS